MTRQEETAMSTKNAVEPIVSPEAALAIQKAIDSGRSLSEILDALSLGPKTEQSTATPSVPAVLSEKAIEAARQLPDVFGSVNPTAVRKLTEPEKRALVEEREIETVLEKEIKNRRTGANGLRQIGNNHLDKLTEERAEKDGTELPPRGKDGHYLNAITDPVDGTGQSLARTTRTTKPQITHDLLYKAFQDGWITHAQWLACTRVPAAPRVFDEDKARIAVKKDPALLALLAQHAATAPEVTIAFDVKPTK